MTNAAGCGSNLKDYVHLLADDPRYAERAAAFSAKVRDVSEVLAEAAVAELSGIRLPLTVAFQDSCHLLHAQRVRSAPRAMLAADPGARRRRAGGAGALLRKRRHLQHGPARGRARARRAQGGERPVATQPDAYASANPGCLIQVTAALRRAGNPLPAFHPVELVDASIRGLSAPALLAGARR